MEPIRSLAQLKQIARDLPSQTVSVVRADETETLLAVKEAVTGGMVDCVLVGPEAAIRDAAAEADFDLNGVRVVHAQDDHDAAFLGVDLIRRGQAGILMKGLVATSTFLKAILDKDRGIRGDGLLSHVAAFEVPSYPKLLLITDAAMNIAPDFDQKVGMLRNALLVARALGIGPPKCTYVCAKEVPYEKMPCTLEAARMQEMALEGVFGDVLFQAPLAMDLAVSPEAARIKKVGGPVAGEADVVLLPDIEAANVLYKTLIFLAGGELGAVIMGAKHPVVLTSRADSAESKLCSLVLSGVVASHIAGCRG